MSGTASQPKRKVGRPRTLRTPENADRICRLIEEGSTLRAIAAELGCTSAAISIWIHEDERDNEGAVIAKQYARAKSFRLEIMAEDTLVIADDRSFMERPDIASAMVTQQRLAVDARKWLLSKLAPRQYGDKVEISHDPDAPAITRIELVAVHPKQLEPPTIDGLDDGSDTSD